MRRRDVQRDVFHECAEVFVLRHEIGLAIHFHQNADFSLQMNVGSDDAFLGRARRFFACAGDALRAQNRLRFFQIAAGFRKRTLAIHHAGVGFFAELLNELRIDFHLNEVVRELQMLKAKA